MRSSKDRKPDFEAHTATVEADEIGEPSKVRRSKTHHAGRIRARGKVEITIRSQYPNSDGNPKRPPAGSVLEGDDAIIEARDANVNKKVKSGRDSATVGRKVGIFGKLRRRKE